MLIWLADVLRAAGLTVEEIKGWQTRGTHGQSMGDVLGVLLHHTAGPKQGNYPSLNTVLNGRSDLSGPLAQLGLGRDGTFYVIAAGKANHAGAGAWKGITEGNTHLLGIEAEGTGVDSWPDVQMDAYRRGVAAILAHVNRTSDFAVGHKEYALPHGRKTDPNFDMDAFREAVEAILNPPTEGADPQPTNGSTNA